MVHLRGFCQILLGFAIVLRNRRFFFFRLNAIVVRIPNPGQIEIEEGGGEEEKLALRGQARSQCESKKNYKKKADDTNVHPSSSIALCFILEWTMFCRFPVTR